MPKYTCRSLEGYPFWDHVHTGEGLRRACQRIGNDLLIEETSRRSPSTFTPAFVKVPGSDRIRTTHQDRQATPGWPGEFAQHHLRQEIQIATLMPYFIEYCPRSFPCFLIDLSQLCWVICQSSDSRALSSFSGICSTSGESRSLPARAASAPRKCSQASRDNGMRRGKPVFCLRSTNPDPDACLASLRWVSLRHSTDEQISVWMIGWLEHLLNLPNLAQITPVHHTTVWASDRTTARSCVINSSNVYPYLKVNHQLQNICLDGYIQGGKDLIA